MAPGQAARSGTPSRAEFVVCSELHGMVRARRNGRGSPSATNVDLGLGAESVGQGGRMHDVDGCSRWEGWLGSLMVSGENSTGQFPTKLKSPNSRSQSASGGSDRRMERSSGGRMLIVGAERRRMRTFLKLAPAGPSITTMLTSVSTASRIR